MGTLGYIFNDKLKSVDEAAENWLIAQRKINEQKLITYIYQHLKTYTILNPMKKLLSLLLSMQNGRMIKNLKNTMKNLKTLLCLIIHELIRFGIFVKI